MQFRAFTTTDYWAFAGAGPRARLAQTPVGDFVFEPPGAVLPEGYLGFYPYFPLGPSGGFFHPQGPFSAYEACSIAEAVVNFVDPRRGGDPEGLARALSLYGFEPH